MFGVLTNIFFFSLYDVLLLVSINKFKWSMGK
jgi:hypothetical protein